jgi:hypothetical protein
LGRIRLRIRLVLRRRPDGWFIEGGGSAYGPYDSLAQTQQMAQDRALYLRKAGCAVDIESAD